jgi:large subunit ribosomal protein L2
MLINRGTLIKNLSKYKKKFSGRSSTSGKISIRHRGGGKKLRKKIIDNKRFLWNCSSYVFNLEFSHNHSAHLALLVYPIGLISYIIAPSKIKIGDKLTSGEIVPIQLGNNTFLKNIPLNIKIHNIETFPKSGGKLVRAAGAWAKITEKNNKVATLLFKNGKTTKLSIFCTASIGEVSNHKHKVFKVFKKAGDKRAINFRPKVRGVAMNAVDHPHGGGKGKKSPKNPIYNFIRKLPKGKKTKKNV